jgi:hypothetical protein
MDALAYANMCFSSGGFTSYAPPPLTESCKPGFVVKGCKSARRYTGTFLAGALTIVLRLDPFESYQVIAIVDRASSATVTLDDWTVDGESLFTKVENENQSPGFGVIGGLGAVTGLDPELYRSGLNPLPPQPFIDNTHAGLITLTGALADVLDIFVYFGNPPGQGDMAPMLGAKTG